MAEQQGERQSWTLCISGDVDRMFIVSVDMNNTVAQLKAVIERRLSAPVDQQTLYFQEQVMHNDSVLNSISGLDHGGMVYLSRRRYFSLTIYSWLSGSLEKVQLKLSYNIVNQTLSSLKKTICQRFGVKDPIFICEEDILDACYDDMLLHNSVITDGAVVILQKTPVSVSLTDQDTSFSFYVPQRTTIGFLKQQLSVRTGSTISQIESGVFSVNSSSAKCYYFAKTDDSHQISEPFNIIKQGWGLDVQRLDGTKLSFQVECCENTPIVKLRELVEECTGVPTHQQRLTIGSTIVEDWDDEDRMMFIGDYPNIHDGSLLYLVQLEGGSRMRVRLREDNLFVFTFDLGLIKKGPVEYRYQTKQFYVNDMKSSDKLKRKLKIQTFSQSDGGSYTTDSKGRTLSSSQGQETVNVYDRIGPDFQVFLYESEIVW